MHKSKKKNIAKELLKSVEQALETVRSDIDLTIYHKGKPHSTINRGLINRQNCWNNVTAIIAEHNIKLNIYEAIEKETDVAALKAYAQILTELEFRLQELWGFPKDAKFHRFWLTPKCDCPKWDNEDSYPTGYSIVNMGCLLHGDLK